MYEEKILVIDYGSQYTQLIARRIRENNTYCEVLHPKSLNKKESFNKVIGTIQSVIFTELLCAIQTHL